MYYSNGIYVSNLQTHSFQIVFPSFSSFLSSYFFAFSPIFSNISPSFFSRLSHPLPPSPSFPVLLSFVWFFYRFFILPISHLSPLSFRILLILPFALYLSFIISLSPFSLQWVLRFLFPYSFFSPSISLPTFWNSSSFSLSVCCVLVKYNVRF